MNIVRKKVEEHTFNEVNVGGVLEYCDSIFMRSKEMVSNGCIYNAICLEDGTITYFRNDEIIRFVNADLVIH